jgi:DNA polymerase V
MLLELQPDTVEQLELDLQVEQHQDRGRLMASIDEINDRFGRGTLLMASAGLTGDKRIWSMKQERRTPAYTTCLADIPIARA